MPVAPKVRRHQNRMKWIIIFILLGFVGIFLYFGSLFQFATTPFRPQTPSDSFYLVEIHRGENAWQLAKTLQLKGIISDASAFHRLGRLTKKWNFIKAGEYKVTPSQTPLEIFTTLTSGISWSHPITIREGENMYQIAATISAEGLAPKEKLLELMKDPDFIQKQGFQPPLPASLEGYLFPDTYFFNKTMSPEEMIKQMVRHFWAVWGQDEEHTAQTLGFTRHEIITLASIIEKETGVGSERTLVSSVFHNRLKKRIRLQSDPTIIYGIWERYTGNLKRSDILEKTAFNTYVINRLPPGPISNPGKASIDAALHPAESDYLFFVSHNDGTHEFSTTLAQHNEAVRKFQLNRKARQGKSWRDLKAWK